MKDGAVDISGDASLCFVCCANRYGLGSKTIAVYRNFGLLTGALASTISHDSHNLTVCYRSADDAWLAAETLRNCRAACARQTTAAKRTLSFLRQG